MNQLFYYLTRVINDIGILDGDCHPNLPRGKEFKQLGLGIGAISFEEAMCLAGLLYITKPNVILELGTETGASSLILGAVAKDMGNGAQVFTVDKQPNQPEIASKIKATYGLPINFVSNITSLDFINKFFVVREDQTYFAFSDTDIVLRPVEVELLRQRLPKGSVIAVHDTSDLHPYGPMNLKEKLHKDMQILDLPSPRGLTILRT
jgi:predicted O-methyltransferase YrrM